MLRSWPETGRARSGRRLRAKLRRPAGLRRRRERQQPRSGWRAPASTGRSSSSGTRRPAGSCRGRRRPASGRAGPRTPATAGRRTGRRRRPSRPTVATPVRRSRCRIAGRRRRSVCWPIRWRDRCAVRATVEVTDEALRRWHRPKFLNRLPTTTTPPLQLHKSGFYERWMNYLKGPKPNCRVSNQNSLVRKNGLLSFFTSICDGYFQSLMVRRLQVQLNELLFEISYGYGGTRSKHLLAIFLAFLSSFLRKANIRIDVTFMVSQQRQVLFDFFSARCGVQYIVKCNECETPTFWRHGKLQRYAIVLNANEIELKWWNEQATLTTFGTGTAVVQRRPTWRCWDERTRIRPCP